MRIIHNTSFIVQPQIEQEWIGFIRENYIAYLKAEAVINDLIFTKVSIDQPDGKTYSIQVIFDSEKDLELFTTLHLPVIEKKIIGKYKNHYLCFSSILKEI